MIVTLFGIGQTSTYYPSVFSFMKDCAPSTCGGHCVHGTCNPVTQLCDCEAGWDNDVVERKCKAYFATNTTELCPMESLQLSWDMRGVGFNEARAAFDYVIVFEPNATPLPLSSIQGTGGQFAQSFWRYVDGTLDGGTLALTGSFIIPMYYGPPGLYQVVYLMNDIYDIRSYLTFTFLSASDARCRALYGSPTETAHCNGHGTFTGGKCACDIGYFGYFCEHGCGGVKRVAMAGYYIQASEDGFQGYVDHANCTWVFDPTDAGWAVQSFKLAFSKLKLTPNDILSVYEGVKVVGQPIARYDNKQLSPPTFVFPAKQITVNFVSNQENPSWPQNDYFGFSIFATAAGCAPGKALIRNASTNVIECLPCPAGSYSSSSDSTMCLPCPIHTFAMREGSTTCAPCTGGSFQPEQGKSFCLACKAYGFPDGCGVDTRLEDTAIMGVEAMGGIEAIFVVVASILIVLFRRYRVIFASSIIQLQATLVGSLLLCASLMLKVWDSTLSICQAASALSHIGRLVILGSIFAKEYRLHKIFNSNVVRAHNFGSVSFLLVNGLVILGGAVILIVEAAVSPINTINDLLPECDGEWFELFVVIRGLYELIWCIAVLVLLYRVRRVPTSYSDLSVMVVIVIAMFNESLLTILMTVAFALSYANSRLAQGIVTIVLVAIIIIALYVPKLYSAISTSRTTLSTKARALQFVTRRAPITPSLSAVITGSGSGSGGASGSGSGSASGGFGDSFGSDLESGHELSSQEILSVLYTRLEQEEAKLKVFNAKRDALQTQLADASNQAFTYEIAVMECLYELAQAETEIGGHGKEITVSDVQRMKQTRMDEVKSSKRSLVPSKKPSLESGVSTTIASPAMPHSSSSLGANSNAAVSVIANDAGSGTAAASPAASSTASPTSSSGLMPRPAPLMTTSFAPPAVEMVSFSNTASPARHNSTSSTTATYHPPAKKGVFAFQNSRTMSSSNSLTVRLASSPTSSSFPSYEPLSAFASPSTSPSTSPSASPTTSPTHAATTSTPATPTPTPATATAAATSTAMSTTETATETSMSTEASSVLSPAAAPSEEKTS